MGALRARRGDEGFTLIELLVVMIIIGILAAVAVPVLVGQRAKAGDTAIRSDLRTMALAQETYYADAETYLAIPTFTATPTVDEPIRLSRGVTVKVVVNAAGSAFCLVGRNSRASHDWVWVSTSGGQQVSTVTVCPASF